MNVHYRRSVALTARCRVPLVQLTLRCALGSKHGGIASDLCRKYKAW